MTAQLLNNLLVHYQLFLLNFTESKSPGMMLSARRLLALTAPQTRSFSAPKKAKVNFAVDSVVGKGPYVMAGMGVAYCMMGLVSGAPKAAASSEDSAAATAVAAAATATATATADTAATAAAAATTATMAAAAASAAPFLAPSGGVLRVVLANRTSANGRGSAARSKRPLGMCLLGCISWGVPLRTSPLGICLPSL